MGLSGLLDSNTIIDFIGDNLPEESNQFLSYGKFAASQISLIEVLGFPMEEVFEKRFRAFFDAILLIPIEMQVIEMAIQLRKSKKIKLGDSIVAATSLISDLPLVTRNVDDFKSISGIQVLNPFNLNS